MNTQQQQVANEFEVTPELARDIFQLGNQQMVHSMLVALHRQARRVNLQWSRQEPTRDCEIPPWLWTRLSITLVYARMRYCYPRLSPQRALETAERNEYADGYGEGWLKLMLEGIRAQGYYPAALDLCTENEEAFRRALLLPAPEDDDIDWGGILKSYRAPDAR